MISPEKRHQIMTGLKNMTLQRDVDFAVLEMYFFDHLVDTGLLEQYKRIIDKNRESFFIALVNPILKYFKTPVSIATVMLTEVPGEAFTHGIVFLSNGFMLNLFFFDDVNTGLASFPNERGGTEYFRISAFKGERTEGSAPIIGAGTVSRATH